MVPPGRTEDLTGCLGEIGIVSKIKLNPLAKVFLDFIFAYFFGATATGVGIRGLSRIIISVSGCPLH